MAAKPSLRKTNFSILCRLIVLLGAFSIPVRLRNCFSIFLCCCSSLLSQWLFQTSTLLRSWLCPRSINLSRWPHRQLVPFLFAVSGRLERLYLPSFSLLTSPWAFTQITSPWVLDPNLYDLAQIMLYGGSLWCLLGLTDSFLSTYQRVLFSLIFKTNLSCVLSPEGYAVFLLSLHH